MDILGDERRTLEQIAQVEEKKVDILSRPGLEPVEELDARERELVEALNALEKERFFAAANFSRGVEKPTLKELIEAVPVEEKRALVQIQHSITAVISRLQFLKSVTMALIDDKRKLTDLSLAALGCEDRECYTGSGEKAEQAKSVSPLIMDCSV